MDCKDLRKNSTNYVYKNFTYYVISVVRTTNNEMNASCNKGSSKIEKMANI